MFKRMRCLLALNLLLVLFSGCAARHSVILVADPDGKVGRAEVTTSGGKQLLEKQGDMIHVSGTAAPSAVTTADPKFIAVRFADALAIEPQPSAKFILFFETGTTKLTPESQAIISTIVETIKKRNAITITVSGHTDAVGSVEFNDRLSRERAELARDILVQKGVMAERIAVSSHGKGNPLVPTPDGVAEPRNRRVEIVVR